MIRAAQLIGHAWRQATGALLFAAWAAGAGAAETPAALADDVFAVTVPAVGRSQDELKPAYLDALKRVIVAVTGRDEAGRDPALLARFGDPADYVERYQSDGAGIRVQFNRSLTRNVLVAAGYLPSRVDSAMTGTEGRTAIRLIVTNINRPDDYGAVLQIFRAMEPDVDVSVLAAAGDAVTLLVSSRAGVVAIRNALAEQGSLQLEAPGSEPADSGETMHYRYATGL